MPEAIRKPNIQVTTCRSPRLLVHCYIDISAMLHPMWTFQTTFAPSFMSFAQGYKNLKLRNVFSSVSVFGVAVCLFSRFQIILLAFLRWCRRSRPVALPKADDALQNPECVHPNKATAADPGVWVLLTHLLPEGTRCWASQVAQCLPC